MDEAYFLSVTGTTYNDVPRTLTSSSSLQPAHTYHNLHSSTRPQSIMKTQATLILLVTTLTTTAHGASCTGAANLGHCCNGSIYRSDPSGNLDDPSTWTCCQGANPSVTNSQGTCPSGDAISLADAPTVDGSGASGGSSASSAAISVSVAAPNTRTTKSAGTTSTSVSSSASSTPSVSPATQNSTNAANELMTDTSLLSRALIAAAVAFAL